MKNKIPISSSCKSGWGYLISGMIKEPISQIDRVHFLNQIRLVMREEKSNLRINAFISIKNLANSAFEVLNRN